MPARSKLKSPYHYCGRCSVRRHLSEMEWQAGVLVCNTGQCRDTEIVGTHEAAIAKALAKESKEGQPDDKLITPPDSMTSEDIVF